MSDTEPKLPKVPQVGGLLELSQEQIKAVNNNPANKFFGDKAVEMGFVSREKLNDALLSQSSRMSDAALQDIDMIVKDGKTLSYPPFLQKPQFGNNGINIVENPTRVDAASASANLARTMTVIANNKPELANDLQPFVDEANKLTKTIVSGEKAPEFSLKLVMRGLQVAVGKSGITPADKNGNPVDLEAFIKEAAKQIETGSAQPLQQQQGAVPTPPAQEPSTRSVSSPSPDGEGPSTPPSPASVQSPARSGEYGKAIADLTKGKPIRRFGENDPDAVKEIQERLKKDLNRPDLPVDGKFGPKTDEALRAWQKQNGLKPDGAVGKDTIAKMAEGRVEAVDKTFEKMDDAKAAVQGTNAKPAPAVEQNQPPSPGTTPAGPPKPPEQGWDKH